MIKRILMISLICMTSALLTQAQEMPKEHDHGSSSCPMCCCQKELKKCNYLCHTMPENYQISVPGAPSAIVNDATTNDWFNTFLETINKESAKSTTWSNEACIEMCVHKEEKKLFDFKNIVSITVSCYDSSDMRTKKIIKKREIRIISQSFKRHNRFDGRSLGTMPEAWLYLKDRNNKKITFKLIAAGQAIVE